MTHQTIVTPDIPNQLPFCSDNFEVGSYFEYNSIPYMVLSWEAGLVAFSAEVWNFNDRRVESFSRDSEHDYSLFSKATICLER
jgi:hypothetical protein